MEDEIATTQVLNAQVATRMEHTRSNTLETQEGIELIKDSKLTWAGAQSLISRKTFLEKSLE